MNSILPTLAVLSFGLGNLFSATAHADPKSFMMLKRMEAEVSKPLEIVEQSPAVKTFDQLIDHAGSRGTEKFKQRYFIDSTYAKDANSPVIYYICGEGTCEGATGTPLVDAMAKKYHAHRVALEHRYYGYSVPFNSLAPTALKYLSMDQAIEDLATFQKYVRDVLGLKGKWLSIGGSYPGELSAFYRLKHPELVVGALASSAPVLAKADFEEYDHHIAKVAGPECLQEMQSAVVEIEGRLNDPASALAVKKLFNADMVVDNVDFLYVVADMAATAIQYGYQTQFCSALKQGAANNTLVASYAAIGNKLFAAFNLTSLQDSFQGATSTDPKDYLGWAGMRSWMYQSCTEFGFYQIAYHIPAESSRSSRIDMAYHNEACRRLFGLTVPVDVNRTNAKYYNQLLNPSVTHIYFTNGGNDPWSNLGITATDAARNPNLSFFLIPGAAHCDDLGSRVSDALTQARTKFDALMGQWLK